MEKTLGGRKSVFILCAALLLAGCAAMFMKGGALVDASFKPDKVLVAYRAEGPVPQGVEYFLIETAARPAFFERSKDGSGALFQTHWRDNEGDHFAGWVANSHGYEFVVPDDRTKPAKRFVYPVGTYHLQDVGGATRPVPTVKVEPVTRLVPK